MDEQSLYLYAQENPTQFRDFCKNVSDFVANSPDYRRENGSPIELCRSPYLIDASTEKTLRKVSISLYNILDKVLNDICSNQRYKEVFPEHSVFDRLLQVPRRYGSSLFLLRFDFILDKNIPKLLEFNTSCPAGMCFLSGWRQMLSQGYSSLPNLNLFGDFPLDDPLFFCRQIVSIAKNYYGIERPVTVGIVNDNTGQTLELSLIKKRMEELVDSCHILNLNQLKFVDGKVLDDLDNCYDIIYCKTHPTPSVKMGWSSQEMMNYSGFLEACQRDSICILNPIRSLTVGEDKGMLALLKSGELDSIFLPEEKIIISDYVPTTYFLEEAQLESNKDLISSRERFLIKPRMETRGAFILFGRDYEAEEWKKVLRERCNGQWIVQKFIKATPKLTALVENGDVVWKEVKHTFSVFMIGGVCSGMYARTAPGDIHNVGAGGYMQTVSVVKDTD